MARAVWFFLAPLVCSLAAAPPAFERHVVDTGLKGGYQVVIADMNRDRRPDLIALASGMTELLWYENPGWQRHVISTGLRGMINVAPLVSGGDGIPELLLASGFSMDAKKSAGIVTLYRHQGDPAGLWTGKEIDRLPTSHRIRVANGVFVNVPLTNAEAVAPDYRGHVPVVLYRPPDFRRESLSDVLEGVVHGIFVVDWNHDRRDDILTASFGGIDLFESQKDGRWKRQHLAGGHGEPWPKCGSSDIAVGQIGKTRYLAAIEPWHGNEVVVYLEKRRRWERTVIDDTLTDGHTIITADLEGDGTEEIIAGARGAGGTVRIYSRTGDKWERTVLDDKGITAAACAAGDLNGDKRIDIVCIGSATANLAWYENRGR